MPLADMIHSPSSAPSPTAGGVLEVLTFGMGGETFALDAVLVREILDMMPRTGVPGADPLVGHVINFRGRVIPLADLRPAYGMEKQDVTPDSRIIVIEMTIDGEATLIGLTTDSVDEVTTFDTAACEQPPAIGMRWPRGHVRCLVRRAHDIVVLPDLDALFRGFGQSAMMQAA